MRAARLRRSGDIKTLRAEGRSLRRASFSARLRRTAAATLLVEGRGGDLGNLDLLLDLSRLVRLDVIEGFLHVRA